MLPICILPKYTIRPSSIVLSQWINVTMRSCSSSSSSDSSSSDSDSDNEKAKPKRMYVKSTDYATSNDGKNLGSFLDTMIQKKTSENQLKGSLSEKIASKKTDQKTTESIEGATNLMDYVNNMMAAKKLEKTIDVAMPKKKKSKDTSRYNHLSYEKKLTKAAEDVADTIGGDKTKTTSELLEKVLASRIEVLKQEQSSIKQKLQEISQSAENKNEESYATQKSVIHDLLKEYRKQSVEGRKQKKESLQFKAPSKTSAQQTTYVEKSRRQHIDLWNGKPSGIFDTMGSASPDTPELKTWTALHQRELKMLTVYPPANIFQEMILWTEQGKLWKFPIDNEQGMEEEHNVHFSEHVFLERHLKGWCPKSGPIRHFMELVCNGLSKNPYMTVQEKFNHIMWYREYFESKQDLLREIGAIQEPFPDKAKEIQE
ncbi:hypothetical protein DMN91_002479 [Ooceraea biroi]|nr:28S ribosomal protein S31, mitochondrial [Ooceraea biroi]RLU24390.1 hypothetical protein DMN91_002479 [Ooceraea biroi]